MLYCLQKLGHSFSKKNRISGQTLTKSRLIMKIIFPINLLHLTFFVLSFLFVFPPTFSPAATLDDDNADSERGSFMKLVDEYHSYLEGRVNQPAMWFDNFFGEPRADDDELPQSFVRLRVSSQFTEGEGFTFPVRLRVNMKLPRASNKLRLIIVGQSEDELLAKKDVDDNNLTAADSLVEEKSSVGLRYTLYQNIRSRLHFGGGTSLSPFEYYGSTNFKRLIHIADNDVVTFSQTGTWNSIYGLSETTQFDFEKIIWEEITLRLSVTGTYYDSDPDTDDNNGLNWGGAASFYKLLSTKTAASLDLGIYGLTRPSFEISNYRVAYRVRTNTLRPWLFFEIEPEVTFPLSDDGARQAVGAFYLMTEIQFASP